MWRAFFLAVGIFLCIVGAECLVIDKAVLAQQIGTAAAESGETAPHGKEIVPPDWAPWSLMAAGAVVILYSFTIPKRVNA